MEQEKKLNEQQPTELTDEELKQAAGGGSILDDYKKKKRRPMIGYLCDVCGWASGINYNTESISFDEGLERMKRLHAEKHPECLGIVHSR